MGCTHGLVCPTHLGSRLAGLLGSLLHFRGCQHVVLPVAQRRVGHTVHALQRRDVLVLRCAELKRWLSHGALCTPGQQHCLASAHPL